MQRPKNIVGALPPSKLLTLVLVNSPFKSIVDSPSQHARLDMDVSPSLRNDDSQTCSFKNLLLSEKTDFHILPLFLYSLSSLTKDRVVCILLASSKFQDMNYAELKRKK